RRDPQHCEADLDRRRAVVHTPKHMAVNVDHFLYRVRNRSMPAFGVEFVMAGLRDDFGFVLNGQSLRVSGIGPQTTLLDFVRSRGFTGAKEGCAEGECGACAVLLVVNSTYGTVYRSVNSCLVPLPPVAGQEICTVEALAESGQLAEVQRAMAAGGGSQC